MDRMYKLFLLLIVSILLVSSLCFAADTSEEKSVCICDCVYAKSPKIRNPDYFSKGDVSQCDALDGQGCLGVQYGTRYKGQLNSCNEGPVPLFDSAITPQSINFPTQKIAHALKSAIKEYQWR